MDFLKHFFTPSPKRVAAKYQSRVDAINALEPAMAALSDEALRAKTQEFRDRVTAGETLEQILPEAFAVVREAGKRVSGMRHYDVQMIGGMVLHEGKIAEMRTGEGKTLVATLPTYLNALAGKGVHVVTVNDYLAKRDAVWMGKIYDFLGMTVGIVQNQRVSFQFDASVRAPEVVASTEGESLESQTEAFKIEDEFLRPCSRQEAYRCDITYGTNNEYGFDYLRDNMVQGLDQMVMRPGSEMAYAIVDEVDSILIDEARTPLIISSQAEEATDQYYQFAKLVRQLNEKNDYNVDEKMRSATLTEAGIDKFEQWLGIANIYEEGGIRTVHHIEQALKAEVLFKRDRDYMIDNGEILIIDEFTGRKMVGRRYSEGLHQAIEAKENVEIQRESQTLATITFQNLFRMYGKLSGMTGTASTESEELFKIYQLEVVTIPTNKSDRRTDQSDRIYKTEVAKFRAVAEKIKECRANNQPILIGTISVEKNERLSEYLTSLGISHETLNAKNHEREGEIIAQAGRPGAVTLATNMAGRGVDIKLGGVPAVQADIETVVAAGGLFVLGTERHESRRIDNQLRGRAARQGDPGVTQFFVSTEDDLMRIFAGDRLKNVMTRLNVPEDMPIEQAMITRMLENAQKKVEAHHYDTRKHLLEYDDVLNRQRNAIYNRRRQILEIAAGNVPALVAEEADTVTDADEEVPTAAVTEKKYQSLRAMIEELVSQEIETVVSYHTAPAENDGEWDIAEIEQTMRTIFPLTETESAEIKALAKHEEKNNEGDAVVRDRLIAYLVEKARTQYDTMTAAIVAQAPTPEDAKHMLNEVEKAVLLRCIDMLWVEHLVAIDYLRAGIGLQGYGQRDPLIEYKRQTFSMFNELLATIQKEVVYTFFKVNVGIQLAPSIMATDELTLKGAEGASDTDSEQTTTDQVSDDGKTGRNEPCYCGSGKKFKKCHGK